jgi:hypothetical protein
MQKQQAISEARLKISSLKHEYRDKLEVFKLELAYCKGTVMAIPEAYREMVIKEAEAKLETEKTKLKAHYEPLIKDIAESIN